MPGLDTRTLKLKHGNLWTEAGSNERKRILPHSVTRHFCNYVTLGQSSEIFALEDMWGWRINCGIVIGFSLNIIIITFISLLTGDRAESHISWQWLLMVNINDGQHRHNVTTRDNKRDVIRLCYTWHVAVTRHAGLRTTAALTTQLSWAVNWYGGFTRLFIWYTNAWKAHVFVITFCASSLYPLMGSGTK